MKKKVFLAAALIALMAVGAFAQQYNSESDFQVTKAGNAITITGFVGTGTVVSIPPQIQNLPVTAIGDRAFYGKTGIESVTIPNGVTSIGASSFGRTNIVSVTIPDTVNSIGNQAFVNCKNLFRVTIPDSVTTIQSAAFNQCSELSQVTIGSGVTYIGVNAFANCTNLVIVEFKNAVPTSPGAFNSNAFPGDLREKSLAGGVGEYTRQNNSTTWTKQ